ncbi:MAG: SIS domain-containing protein [Proteobacteria bacterium]|nr:SIS domain-containing protein [Pseudomonadota bacterium]
MKFLDIDEAALQRAGAVHTAREIAQQPDSWIRTATLLRGQQAAIRAFLAPLLANPQLRVILTGAGSSAFIGECLAPPLLQALGRRVEAIATTDILSAPRQYLQPGVPTLLVSFGRSGSSPESVAVVDQAEQLLPDCHQLVFTCNAQGTLYQRCHAQPRSYAVLLPPETHDAGFAMTSSFTSMLLAAWLVFADLREPPPGVEQLAAAARTLLATHHAALRQLAAGRYARAVFLGSNALKGVAREAALKLLELTDGAVVATHDSPLGFRHGPKTIINGDTLLFVLLSNDPYTRSYDLDLLRELRTDGRAGRVVALTARAGDAAMDGDHLLIEQLADADDGVLAFPYALCAQLYAFHRALALGNTPDQPSASGTVSRVVSGVRIHALPAGSC